MAGRLDVRKTYKLYVGGAFPRSECGRRYEVVDGRGRFLANAAQASRKDARDAVVAARKAFDGWAGATAYNRGQVLYRVAEVLEGRRDQFVAEVRRRRGRRPGERRPPRSTRPSTDGSGTRAGPTRSRRSTASSNPVAGPYFNFSTPEPDRRGGRARAAGVVAARPGVGRGPGGRRRQHRRRRGVGRVVRSRR